MVGETCSDASRHYLNLLLRTFSVRRWNTPFALDDIQALLGVGARLSFNVANLGLAERLFEQIAEGYRLSQIGEKFVRDITDNLKISGGGPPGSVPTPVPTTRRRRRVNDTDASSHAHVVVPSTAPKVPSPKSAIPSTTPVVPSTELPMRSLVPSVPLVPELPKACKVLQAPVGVPRPDASVVCSHGADAGVCGVEKESFPHTPFKEIYINNTESNLYTHSEDLVSNCDTRFARNTVMLTHTEHTEHSISTNSNIVCADTSVIGTSRASTLGICSLVPSSITRSQVAGTTVSKARVRLTKRVAPKTDTDDVARVWCMASTYASAYMVYNNSHARGFAKAKLVPGSQSYKQFSQAVKNADVLGVSFEQYIKAQFYWFDKWYSRAPAVWELCSTNTKCNSLERVKSYVLEGQVTEQATSAPVVGRVIPAPTITLQAKFNQSDLALRMLMRNYQLSEEEVLRVFAKGEQASAYFDRAWLKANATYQRLRAAGEI